MQYRFTQTILHSQVSCYAVICHGTITEYCIIRMLFGNSRYYFFGNIFIKAGNQIAVFYRKDFFTAISVSSIFDERSTPRSSMT